MELKTGVLCVEMLGKGEKNGSKKWSFVSENSWKMGEKME